MNALLRKYDVPAPRYTSYPTVPYWQKEAPAEAEWLGHVRQAYEASRGISLYIHLPFCEKLCTYCGCNKRITKNHGVEQPYINSVLKEWQLYLDALPGKPVLKEIHLGGGTPTFFSPDNLRHLLEGIFAGAIVPEEHEFGFEAHPAGTTTEHLEILYGMGFRRLSIGVQDFDNHILKVINRQQSLEDVQRVTAEARRIGYTSLNYDLIFGLPFQTPENIRRNMELIRELRPDRLAFYSYAHVPWIKPSQRAYSEADLPLGKEKHHLYEYGRELLTETGYLEIGMDHFALSTDSLFLASQNGRLHRNFMGYTPLYTRLSLALGASSISDTWTAFVQNEKHIEAYAKVVESGHLPISKGHILTEEDLVLRKHILDIMCRYRTSWNTSTEQNLALADSLLRMHELLADGLVEIGNNTLTVTDAGKPFIRNICMALDARYWHRQPDGQLFSQAV